MAGGRRCVSQCAGQPAQRAMMDIFPLRRSTCCCFSQFTSCISPKPKKSMTAKRWRRTFRRDLMLREIALGKMCGGWNSDSGDVHECDQFFVVLAVGAAPFRAQIAKSVGLWADSSRRSGPAGGVALVTGEGSRAGFGRTEESEGVYIDVGAILAEGDCSTAVAVRN